MNLTDKNKTSLFLWSFIIIGALLRFYNLGDWSLTNDELSALNRTQHDSNFALWKSYASIPDTHPPLAQFFIYNWTKLFGSSPFMVRLPFVLMGILCIPLSYRLFNRWFSPTTGVFIASFVAFSNYTIVYTQLARPYGIGLFFGLLFTYYWTKLIISKRYTFKTYLLYVITGISAIYIHYFLSLTVLIIIITGLFMTKKHRIKSYLLINLLIGLSFIPFLKYFLLQFSIGGVGGWLPSPDNTFYLNYLHYAFNNNFLIPLILLVTCLIGIKEKVVFSKRNWILLVWGLTPFLIGFFYSKYFNPVLQFSTLVFSFPFLLGFILSTTETLEFKKKTIKLIILFSFAMILTTAINWRYYHESSFGEFKQTAKTLADWTTEINVDYDVIGNMVDPFYYNYYLKQQNWNDTFLMSSITTTPDLAVLKNYLKTNDKEQLAFTWANTNNPFELKELIRYYYPKIEKSKRLNNAEVIIYKKGNKSPTVFNYQLGFDSLINKFGYPSGSVVTDSTTANSYFQVPAENEYPLVVKDILGKDLPIDSANIVTFMIHFKSEIPPNAIIAISIDNDDGNVKWRGTDLAPFHSMNEWNMTLVSLYLPEGIGANDKIKAYVWNREKETFLIDDVSFFAYSDSQYYLK